MSAPVAWPGAETALDNPLQYSEWDVLYLAGQFVPGVVEVSGTVGRKVEKRSEPGTTGGTQTYLNYELAEFDVRVRMWTAKHFDQWLVIMSIVQPAPGRASTLQPVDALHPALDAHGITKVVVLNVGLPKKGGTPGVMEATIRLREHRTGAVKKVTTATTSLEQSTKFDEKLPPVPSQDPAIIDPNFDIGLG